jgi:hypothetical protein
VGGGPLWARKDVGASEDESIKEGIVTLLAIRSTGIPGLMGRRVG